MQVQSCQSASENKVMNSTPRPARGYARRHLSRMAAIVIGAFSVLCSLPGATVDIAQGPLYLGRNVPGNLALVPSVEYPTLISQANIGPYDVGRPEEHTSELPSLMRTSYAVFCLTKKNR